MINRNSDSSTTISIIGTEKDDSCLTEHLENNTSGYSIAVARDITITKVNESDSETHFAIELLVNDIELTRRQMQDEKESARKLNS